MPWTILYPDISSIAPFQDTLEFDLITYDVLCYVFQVEVDWERINAKVEMELQKEAERTGTKH